MSARAIRRAAEREALKAARKSAPQPLQLIEPRPAISPARLAANQANALLSTGPVTPEGKAISAQNRTTHGLARRNGPFKFIAGEDPEDFAGFTRSLINEHQPTSETEFLLVTTMVESHWLANRAQRMQSYVCEPGTGLVDNQKLFALYLRYETTHRRAFYKALNELQKLRAERRKAELGFEAQRLKVEVQKQKTERHEMEMQTRRWQMLRKKSEDTGQNADTAGPNPGFESQFHAAEAA